MTKAHAARQLLRHGPLALCEFVAITGWPYKTCIKTLRNLRGAGQVVLLRRGAGVGGSSFYAGIA
jgi:hypothetical protein